ncbi:cytochrome P450 [Nocardia sp. NPDC050406]|uniref:cytochrome P450 n=1 Tax=Nocardia sp. NPDC050406 TaxID=3364318 RepID=UPI0037943604
MTAQPHVTAKPHAGREPVAPGCPVHRGPEGVWTIQDYAGAREFLRHTDTRQGGFEVEYMDNMPVHIRRPVIYRDGPEHREHRRQTARFFTPRRVDAKYRELMRRAAEEQCDRLRASGRADLSEMSFLLSVVVAAEVIGLDGDRARMARRLDRFFAKHTAAQGWDSPQAIYRMFQILLTMSSFFLANVWPSVRARRQRRRDDLISHLLDDGCTPADILGECVTFAAAGMITTREFITMAAWHLFTDDELRTAYRTGDEQARYAILHEILRLDPVVSDLYRYTTAEVTLTAPDGPVTIPSGAKVDVRLAAANRDPAAVGDNPDTLCPARPVADGVADYALSFGDGQHRCPGAAIAIQETDVFLTTLFALPGLRMTKSPTVRDRPEISSYELVGLEIAVD